MKFQKLSFQFQIFIALLALVILPSITLGIVTSNRTATQVSEKYSETLNTITDQTNLNIDTLLSDAEKIGDLHILNDSIGKILVTDYSKNMDSLAKDWYMMKTQVVQANRLNPNVIISIFKNKYDYIFDYGFTTQRDLNDTVQNLNNWIELARDDPHYSYVGPIQHPKFSGTKYKNIVPMVKILMNPYTNTEIGAFFVGINFEAVANILESSKLPNSRLIFFDRDNNFFFSSDKDFNTENNTGLIDHFSTLASQIDSNNSFLSSKTESDNKKYSFNIAYNKTTSWKIVHFMDDTIITDAYTSNLTAYTLIFFVVLIGGLVLAYIFSRSLTKPINSLCLQIDQFTDDDLHSIKIEHAILNRDLQKLIDSYNSLNKRLVESLNQNYITSLNERQIKLKMLQEQINPHFMYNTLNLISSIANIHDIPEIRTIAVSMSELLRYNLKSGPIVNLFDEISHIYKYIAIQQIKYPDKFIFECSLPEELSAMKIPTFILQPLIENSLTHGIYEREDKGYIGINTYSEGSDLHILISDNGIGIPEDKLKDIRELLLVKEIFEIPYSNTSPIGIINVHQRIQTYYGKQYGLEIESTYGKGTIVDVKIPLNKQPHLPQINKPQLP